MSNTKAQAVYSLKAYHKDYSVKLNDEAAPEGTFTNAITELEEVEKLSLDIPEFVGHAFGTNTFTVFFADGGASIYRYQDFCRIDIRPIPVEEVTEEEATAGVLVH